MSWYVHSDLLRSTPAGHVGDGDLACIVKRRRDRSNRRVDPMVARCYLSEVLQRDDQADSSVYAHSQVADIVEVDYAGDAPGICGLAEIRANDHFRASRLVY